MSYDHYAYYDLIQSGHFGHNRIRPAPNLALGPGLDRTSASCRFRLGNAQAGLQQTQRNRGP